LSAEYGLFYETPVRGIMLTACGVARIALPGSPGDGDGSAFCREIAQYSGVFAGTNHQCGYPSARCRPALLYEREFERDVLPDTVPDIPSSW